MSGMVRPGIGLLVVLSDSYPQRDAWSRHAWFPSTYWCSIINNMDKTAGLLLDLSCVYQEQAKQYIMYSIHKISLGQ